MSVPEMRKKQPTTAKYEEQVGDPRVFARRPPNTSWEDGAHHVGEGRTW